MKCNIVVNLSSLRGSGRRDKAGHYDRKPVNNRNKHGDDKWEIQGFMTFGLSDIECGSSEPFSQKKSLSDKGSSKNSKYDLQLAVSNGKKTKK